MALLPKYGSSLLNLLAHPPPRIIREVLVYEISKYENKLYKV